jgi:hypothetical protein
MIVSEGRVVTEVASKYLQQLCKHFAHKVDVDYDPSNGRIDFPFGVCVLEAGERLLSMRCEAPDEEADRRMRSVLAVHLERFAWREKAVVSWTPDAPGRQASRAPDSMP